SGSLVERAAAYGMAAEAVDGMDVDAVLEAATRAVTRARRGEGPSFLECRTYRFFGHHTAERTMKLTYRSEDEIERWRERDPLAGSGAKLKPALREQIDADVEQLLDEAVEFARQSPRPERRCRAAGASASTRFPRCCTSRSSRSRTRRRSSA